MNWDIYVSKSEDLVTVKTSGLLSYEQINQMTIETFNTAMENDIRNILGDHRELDQQVSISNIYKLPRELLKEGIRRPSKVAVVYTKASTKEKNFELFETTARNVFIPVQLFTDIAEARLWLTEDDLRTFKTITNVIVLAIENARLHKKIETQLKAISAKAAHRIGNQTANYDAIEMDLEAELDNTVCDKDNLASIHKRLKKNTGNLKKMIGEIRLFGKPVELDKKLCSINAIVQDEVWLAKPQNIKILDKYDCNIPDILIDEGRFAESIKELLSNSMRAVNKINDVEGEINIITKLSIKNNDNAASIIIGDNGPGFQKNFPVFEPFNSTEPGNTGLGLATVKELIEKHGGTIEVGKSSLGGAQVECYIPLNK
jgi:signal transduction histidine kinase